MAQTFFFINGIHVDKASKRQVRRHVMKGKNAGKTVNRPSRLKQHDAKRISNRGVQDERTTDEGDPMAISIPAFGNLSNTSSVFWLPVEVTHQSLIVIHECKFKDA
jgi:hypothetical protein